MTGGFWKHGPVSFDNALSKTFSLSRVSCSLTTQTYSFPADCWDLTRRVARSMQTIRQPVTLGSKVPEWPVFSTLRIFFIQATTSCDEGFDGLSRLITPYFKYSFKGRDWGDWPAGIGV